MKIIWIFYTKIEKLEINFERMRTYILQNVILMFPKLIKYKCISNSREYFLIKDLHFT